MIVENIGLFLIITGAITASMFVLFLFPNWYIKTFLKVEMKGELAVLFARHWGLLVFCVGGLMIWAGLDEAVRLPIILMALIEKSYLAVWTWRNFKKPYAKGMLPGGLFDTVVCLILAAYLFQVYV